MEDTVATTAPVVLDATMIVVVSAATGAAVALTVFGAQTGVRNLRTKLEAHQVKKLHAVESE